MEIRDRIIELMKLRGLKQKDLVDATGASKATVNQWVSGKIAPSNKYDRKLAVALGTNADFLIHGIDDKGNKLVGGTSLSLVNDFKSKVQHIDSWDSSTPLDKDEVEVPFFMEVELAAGSGGIVYQERNGPKLRFSKSTLRRCNVEPENAACVKVNGNSMEPRLYDGDVVGVDLGDKKIVDGKIYAINHDGLLRVKRLYLVGGGGIRINSFNNLEHPDEKVSAEERRTINVIGRIFWSSSIWN
tara:strand:+ start:817 stop:1545 length:729 start_codon:yes stop_codon:yes gene_type:complete